MTGWDDISSLKEKLLCHPTLGDASRVLLLACHGSMASSEQVSAYIFMLSCSFTIYECPSLLYI